MTWSEVGSSANRYEVLGKLAKGGMAEIFLARAASGAGVSKYVVVKRVLPERAADLQLVRMFLDEARLAAQLQHPNIAQVYDVGKLGESYFFSMEYVHGVTIRQLMVALRRNAMPPAIALGIGAGAAAGLHHAHERLGLDGRALGIVHRDISPSNLMLSFEGHVKVVDFGIAKATTHTEQTREGVVRGKIAYLSPEQALGAPLDRRSDIFSLGIVLWEILAGRRLFKRPNDYASMAAVVEEAVPPLPAHVPAQTAELVMRALAKDPDDRYQTAQDMLDDIERVATSLGAAMPFTSLARFVRELYGPQPEPWHALNAQRDSNEAVLIAAEPIPDQLTVVPSNAIERQLAAVADLSTTVGAVEELEVRRTTAVPLVVGDPDPPPSRGWLRTHWKAVILIGATAVAVITAALIATQGYAPDQTPRLVTRVVEPTPTIDAQHEVIADAPVAVVEVQVDAAASEVSDTPALETTPGPRRTTASPSRPSSDERQYSACADHGASKQPVNCTIVACRLRRQRAARAWFARISPAKQDAVIARCKTNGIVLRASDDAPDCDKDPSRCQF
ncbi:MAG TPA: serine/threonine-protein kinase [Kofleriaceae bacterium]|nr:serine/threonine-protein kinase [Kofleriaceae bacterium]